MLKSAAAMLWSIVLFCSLLGAANAQDDPISEALQDCSKELESYCSSVTPGGGRLVSCAKAHEDKLSYQCTSAINRASYWVNFAAHTLSYVVKQCKVDALKYCPDVEVGEERVINCLRENKTDLNKYCSLALKDIGKYE